MTINQHIRYPKILVSSSRLVYYGTMSLVALSLISRHALLATSLAYIFIGSLCLLVVNLSIYLLLGFRGGTNVEGGYESLKLNIGIICFSLVGILLSSHVIVDT